MTESKRKTGVLLVNLGTPDAPTPEAVKRYLAEFLGDPRVVAIPRPIWLPILHGLVLRKRPAQSAEAYAKVWTERGSPLLFLTQDLTQALARHLATGEQPVTVACAMRYGSPGIAAALEAFRQQSVEQLIVLPLYPQYSVTTTVSIYDAVRAALSQSSWQPSTHFVVDYHDDPGYVSAMAAHIKQYRQAAGSEDRLLLFSFHGLPERSKAVGDPYYYQCLTSGKRIAEALGLAPDQWQLVFQSRFGRAKWLMPYCVEVLKQLPARGIQSVDVVCPGFAVDCLETLEEIAMTNREIFIEAGGKQYDYIPALNSTQAHLTALTGILEGYSGNL